jgi:hypothetical protein
MYYENGYFFLKVYIPVMPDFWETSRIYDDLGHEIHHDLSKELQHEVVFEKVICHIPAY